MVSKTRPTPLLARADGFLESRSWFVAGRETRGAYVALSTFGGIEDASCAQLVLSVGAGAANREK